MKTFFMFGKYTAEAIREMSVERTQQAIAEIKKLGGEITAMNAQPYRKFDPRPARGGVCSFK